MVDFYSTSKLTHFPFGTGRQLVVSNKVPDAGHPVSHQGKGAHQQCQHYSTVLRVAVKPVNKSKKTQEAYRLKQVDHGGLNREGQRDKNEKF